MKLRYLISLVFSMCASSFVASAAADCPLDKCLSGADCNAAFKRQASCQRAAAKVRELEHERRADAARRKHKAEIDAVNKINEANKKVRATGTSRAVDPPNR